MERAKVSGTLELVSRYSRRDQGQSEGCHEQAEKKFGEDTECDSAFPAAAPFTPCMPTVVQSNPFSIQRRIGDQTNPMSRKRHFVSLSQVIH